MGRAILTACLPWAGLMVLLVGCLVLLVRLNRSRPNLRRLWRLHADQRGSAQSLSFVLTLPIFVMIMLFILQISQIMIGLIVVQYSAFAAARSAIVWIPARLGTEWENCIGVHVLDPDATDQVQPSPEGPTDGGLTFIVTPGGPKYEKIRRAAVLACVPICPSRDLGLSLGSQGQTTADTLTRAFQAMAPRTLGVGAVPRRTRDKLAYADKATQIEIRFHHRNTDAPHWPPPVVFYETYGIEAPYFFHNELDWQDDVTITVHHDMALLPGPGRFLSKTVRRADGRPDEVAATIQKIDGVYTWPLSATVTLGNEGEKSVIPYVHSIY
ncbi:MAG: pilus assembly protein [Pirellulales bacterium]|nr:pilus assembly protein [Pirellulales bacterium]